MSEQVRASHILLMYAGSARSTASRSKEEALTQIQDLKTQVNDGADFAELAKANSDCPSGQQGGDLGTFGRGMMVPEFDQAAFNMEVGTVSDVVETDFGYHILQRTA
ncbi:peptidylprolyl isomerase [Thalassospira mesophila]|uniref:Parvulin-like PPIase n=1 Tax=Thalassospira mesophila TaxID=1293891 RepID=A0A1Y2KX00_9PROT|nr:peptidylprolyl isomerase [Thalassospira mesophila]OSQ35622.1 parvulin peptidyl-prolyl isomerase [Thalassospira mesophila]